MEDPQIRILLALRRELEEELEELNERIEKLQAYINALNSMIGTSSFTTAEAALGTSPVEDEADREEAEQAMAREVPTEIVILNKERDLDLATVYVEGPDLRVMPADHALYDIKMGAFARFFVERILGNFQKEDRHRVENGEIGWDQAFDFEVKAEDGILQGIIIKNFGDEERLAEIQRTLRWALEKTYVAR
ncbi:MAG: hypothetical protein JSW61_04965 [Candidatus Thorarchaeota archaeon]|nr:MAG: hypothetical protein JSW61_04965 [Candidatus Thorarchaeota archaeon]